MELSVVVSTLNDRERLLPCLDAIGECVTGPVELVVVNGPSADGTTGAVRDRDDVDVLVEISDRSNSVSRNAGFEVTTGDVVAFLRDEYAVQQGWYDAVRTAIDAGSDVVTGPVRGNGSITPAEGPKRVFGRTVSFFEGDNVAFDRHVLEAIDGFDEYLDVGSARDCAHRIADAEFDVTWSSEMAVRSDVGTDGGSAVADWGSVYRSLSYRLAKSYGPRPGVVGRTIGSALRDGLGNARNVLTGEETPTGWISDGVTVTTNAVGGFTDGLRARYGDGHDGNPHGVSTRHDRAVQVYDRRDE